MESTSEKFALFIGRWQPLHYGHIFIINQKLDAGVRVLIAVRDTPMTEDDPFSAYDRVMMIQKYYNVEYPGMVVAIPIPDIESINIGRKVGYEVNFYDGPKEVENISATEIRSKLRAGDPTWREHVPDEVADYIEEIK